MTWIMQQNWQNICQDLPLSQDPVLVHSGDITIECLVDITLKSRMMVNHWLLVIIKLFIDFFYVKTWEARRTITACVDTVVSVVNFSSHEVSLGFLGVFHLWPFTRKRTLTVFCWTAKAVGYPLGTRWRRWWNRWKSCWFFFPYPLTALRKAVGKIRSSYGAVNLFIYGSD